MPLRAAARSYRPARGFTLIELMVVVVIAAILFAIAVPSYITYIRQSRRTEAKTAVLELAGREERYLSTNPAAYTQAPGDLGYSCTTCTAWPIVVGSGYYQLSVCTVPPTATAACPPGAVATGPAYTVTATPVAGQSQTQDTQCTAFAVDSVGRQYAADSTGAYTAAAQAYCWAN